MAVVNLFSLIFHHKVNDMHIVKTTCKWMLRVMAILFFLLCVNGFINIQSDGALMLCVFSFLIALASFGFLKSSRCEYCDQCDCWWWQRFHKVSNEGSDGLPLGVSSDLDFD